MNYDQFAVWIRNILLVNNLTVNQLANILE